MELHEIRLDETLTHLALAGRLDSAGAGEIELRFSSLADARHLPLILDLEQVDFVSSMGIRLLLNTVKTLKRDGQQVAVLNPQPLVREVLDTSGLSGSLILAGSADEAENQLLA